MGRFVEALLDAPEVRSESNGRYQPQKDDMKSLDTSVKSQFAAVTRQLDAPQAAIATHDTIFAVLSLAFATRNMDMGGETMGVTVPDHEKPLRRRMR